MRTAVRALVRTALVLVAGYLVLGVALVAGQHRDSALYGPVAAVASVVGFLAALWLTWARFWTARHQDHGSVTVTITADTSRFQAAVRDSQRRVPR